MECAVPYHRAGHHHPPEAPDKAEFTVNDATTVLAGLRQFRRTGTGPWSSSPPSVPSFTWPVGYYREFWGGMAAPRIIGTEVVGGMPALVIAFIRPDVPAWFRIWERQSDGVVLREDMRAEGHIMDHSYSQLNGPVTVTPPQ